MLKNTLISEDQKAFEIFENKLRTDAKDEVIKKAIAHKAHIIYIFMGIIMLILIALLWPSIRVYFSHIVQLIFLYSLIAIFMLTIVAGLPWHIAQAFRVKENANFKIAVSNKMVELAKEQLVLIPETRLAANKEVEQINKDLIDYQQDCEKDLQNQERILDQLEHAEMNLKKFVSKIKNI